MSAATKNRPAKLRSAIAAFGATLFLAAPALAGDPWKGIEVRPQTMVGTLSCSAVSCHGGGGPRYWGGLAAGGEYVSWIGQEGAFSEGRRHYDPQARLEKHDGDPHALAGQRLSSARFQDVLQRASARADGSVDASMYQRCARCHDPSAIDDSEVLSTQYSVLEPESLPIDKRSRPDAAVSPILSRTNRGIGCETCHGGAKQWLAVHYQRDISREHLLNLGLVDTRKLLVRARLCASCHVGSAENDMNHDMIAAGHPPLRFEQASYEAMISRKHWDDRPVRAAEPDYEVQLWAAGRVAAAEAALALLEGRAGRGHETADRRQFSASWPEFAEGNCFACHQPLRAPAERAPGPVAVLGRDGVATWQTWNLALVNDLARGRLAVEAELLPEEFASASRKLRSSMEASFAPQPDDIAKLARAARISLHAAVRVDIRGRLVSPAGKPLGVEQVLQLLADHRTNQNWDEMCQEVAALAAIMRAVEDRGGQHDRSAIQSLRERLKRLTRGLRFSEENREWPAVFDDAASIAFSQAVVTNIDDARRELNEIRDALIRLQPGTIDQR